MNDTHNQKEEQCKITGCCINGDKDDCLLNPKNNPIKEEQKALTLEDLRKEFDALCSNINHSNLINRKEDRLFEWFEAHLKLYAQSRVDAMQREKNAVLNLLAVLHRDGGHYTAKHGFIKSVEDAIALMHVKWVTNE